MTEGHRILRVSHINELESECTFSLPSHPDPSCSIGPWAQFMITVLRIIYQDENLRVKFVFSEGHGFTTSTDPNLTSPTSVLGHVWAGRADFSKPATITPTRAAALKFAGLLYNWRSVYLYKEIDGQDPVIESSSLLTSAAWLFLGLCFLWYLLIAVSDRLFERRGISRNNPFGAVQQIQKVTVFLLIMVFLQYLATQFTLLFNIPTRAKPPFRTVEQLQQKLSSAEYKAMTPFQLEYDNILCPKAFAHTSNFKQLMADACERNPPLLETNIERGVERLLATDSTPKLVYMVPDSTLHFIKSKYCGLSLMEHDQSSWSSSYYHNDSLMVPEIGPDKTRIFMTEKERIFQNFIPPKGCNQFKSEIQPSTPGPLKMSQLETIFRGYIILSVVAIGLFAMELVLRKLIDKKLIRPTRMTDRVQSYTGTDILRQKVTLSLREDLIKKFLTTDIAFISDNQRDAIIKDIIQAYKRRKADVV